MVDNSRVVGVGKSVDLTSVHGHPIPETHQCVLLTWAQDDYLAPYPVGRKDLKENLFFSKDMFYAVPCTMLKRLNDQFCLVPSPTPSCRRKFGPPRGSFPGKFRLMICETNNPIGEVKFSDIWAGGKFSGRPNFLWHRYSPANTSLEFSVILQYADCINLTNLWKKVWEI